MMKRVAMFLLVITAVPAIMLSLPVWADNTPLTINVKGITGADSLNRLQLLTSTGSNLKSYGPPIPVNWSYTYQDRTLDNIQLRLEALSGHQKICSVKDSANNGIPLGVPSVDVYATVNTSGYIDSCYMVFSSVEPPPPTEAKILNMYLYTDVAADFSVVDYNDSGSLGNVDFSMPIDADGVLKTHTVHDEAIHSNVWYGSTACTYPSSGSSTIEAPAPGETVTVYVQVKDTNCNLSETPPVDEEESIAITSCGQLAEIFDTDGVYHLENNIDCSRITSINSNSGVFKGILDGQGKTVTGLNIANETTGDIGLFKDLQGTVRNINFSNTVVGSTATSQGSRGLIAAKATNATIENIKITGTFEILGGHPEKNDAAGGIVGVASATGLSNVHVATTMKLTRPAHAGGLIGSAGTGTTITDSFVDGFTSESGGCKNKEGNDYYDSQKDCGVGGLIGVVTGTNVLIKTSAAKRGSGVGLHTERNGGGLVGIVYPSNASLTIQDSYAVLSLHNIDHHAGGIIGVSDATNDNVRLERVYAAAQVGGENCDGCNGVLGNRGGPNTESVVSTNSFFDTETTGRGRPGDENGATLTKKETTSNMQTSSIYKAAGWSINTWCFVGGKYPSLKAEGLYTNCES